MASNDDLRTLKELDSRMTCSVCLEPYPGRRPKLLPCFHTFCLSCLEALAQSSQQEDIGATISSKDKDKDFALTITCPTCRKVSPVPAGGVANFQRNFYVDDETDQNTPLSLHCDLCDKEQAAEHSCSECQTKICSQCLSIHSKLLPSHVCQSLTSSCRTTVFTDADEMAAQIKEQTKLLESILIQLDEDENEIEQQRQVVEASINAQYFEGLGKMAEARDECMKSLTTAVETARQELQMKRTSARAAHARLSSLASMDRTTMMQTRKCMKELLPSFLTKGEVGSLQQPREKGGQPLFFLQKTCKMNAFDLFKVLQDFMGHVITCYQPNSDSQTVSEKEIIVFTPEYQTAMKSECYDLRNDVTNLRRDVQAMQVENAKLLKEIADLHINSSTLCKDMSSVQTEITLLKTDQASCKMDNSSFDQTLTDMKTDLAIQKSRTDAIYEDNSNVRTEFKNANDQITSLKQELSTLQTEHKMQVTQAASLQTQMDKLIIDTAKLSPLLTSVQAIQTNQEKDVTAIKLENSNLSKELKSCDQQFTSQKQELTTLQAEHKMQMTQIASLQTQINKLVTDTAKLNSILTSVQAIQTNQEKDVTDLKSENSKLSNELKSCDRQITTLQGEHKTNMAKMFTLQARIKNVGTLVAFFALMDEPITITKKTTIVFGHVVSNVGDAYDAKSGIFTAPVAGTYIFFITMYSADNSNRVRIVQDTERIGFTLTNPKTSSTGHAIVKLSPGEKVWLQTIDNETCILEDKLPTTFSGMLVQPENVGTLMAFFALMDEPITITKKTTIVFGNVQSNLGYAYDAKTGIFTAPVAGTYIFFITMYSDDNCNRVDIIKDNKRIGFTITQPETSSTGHAIVKLSPGEKVWLQTYDNETCKLENLFPTTFSGMLVQAENVGPLVAFFALMDEPITITKKTTIVFGNVQSNVGYAYDAKTGIFTAPVAGTYIFFITMYSDDNCNRVDIVKDSELIGFTITQPKTSSTGHAIVKLSPGEKVWLQTDENETCILDDKLSTTFSGMLVQPCL